MNTAFYFDGKTSKSTPVEVVIWEERLELKLAANGTAQSLFFEINSITAQDFLGEQVLLNLTAEEHGPQLQWTGPEAEDFAKNRLKKNNRINYWEYIITHAPTTRVVIIGVSLIAVVVYLYYGHIAPYTGEKLADTLPQNVEVDMGERIAKQINWDDEDVDSAKTVLLQEFYNLLGYPTSYHINTTYLETSKINAFAIPGGRLYVFGGLVDETDNWQELAAVLAHEVAHINERHSLKMIARSVTGYAMLSMLVGDMGGATALMMESANNLNNMSNSRRFEKEADLEGIAYMKNSNINPQYMTDFMQKMNDLQPGMDQNNRLLEVMSSHPLSSSRIEYIETAIAGDTIFQPDQKSVVLDSLWNALREDVQEVDNESTLAD